MSDLDRLARERGGWVLLFGLALVALATLYPFQFEFSPQTDLVNKFSTTISAVDLIANIVLFVPFGIGMACVLHPKRLGRLVTGMITLVATAGLSISIELLQIWFPARTPSVSDLVGNLAGGLVGLMVFHLWGEEVLARPSVAVDRSRAWACGKGLTPAFLVYSILIVLVSIHLSAGVGLENWDPSFPLLLGSESTPGRSWEGFVSDLHVAKRALSEEEFGAALSAAYPEQVMEEALVVSYRFVGEGPYSDGAGGHPDLVWMGTPPNLQQHEDAPLAGDHWLATAGPAKRLAESLHETSAFTLIMTLEVASTDQWGPARIVSVSRTATDRNLLVGQAGEKLILRIRTPLTGANGAKPVVHIPAVFNDPRSQRLLVTYDTGRLRVCVDAAENCRSIALSPEVLFFHWALGTRWWRLHLGGASVGLYTLLYYGPLFVPCGWLLGLAAARRWQPSEHRGFATAMGIVLPPTANEAVLASARDFEPWNLLLSTVFLVGGLAAANAWEARATRRAPRTGR